jgi:hypothetical protein
MEGSGSNAKLLPVKINGRDAKVMVVSDSEYVQMGKVTFKRADLLYAIGLSSADLGDIKNVDSRSGSLPS